MAQESDKSEAGDNGGVVRGRGRPKRDIDQDDVADAVAELFREGGYEAVSIINTANKLAVSRATLYRTVPTKEDLLGVLFERSTAELTANAQEVIGSIDDPRAQLTALIQLQADAAISMRGYLPVFFGSSHLPTEIVGRWHKWSRKYEAMWVGVITQNMDAGYLPPSDPRIVARLVLGMLIWVSRWWRPREAITADAIAEAATNLLGLTQEAFPKKLPTPPARPRRRSSNRA